MSEIVLPYKFTPRPYQVDLFKAIDSGYKRLITVWHRRAGKDKTLFNIIIKKAFERVGVYYYFFPEFAQGRRVIWDGMDSDGFKFLDHIPPELIKEKNKIDMKISLVNGSIIQIIGTDLYDKVRGSNPVGVVYSEYAYQNQIAWEIVRPILAANGGWAIFNSTPFGKNHFYDLYKMALDNKDWWTSFLTVEDSVDENGNRYIPDSLVQAEIDAGMSEELARQEFYCDFNVNAAGFFYLAVLNKMENEGKFTKVPYDPAHPVETWWDIGWADPTCVWFTQSIGREFRVIDFYQNNLAGLETYAQVLAQKGYNYRAHWFPHDITVTEWGTARSRIEVAQELFGADKVKHVKKLPKGDGINAVRTILPLCVFDKDRCYPGILALQNYRKAWDPVRKEYKSEDVHDWASDPADAFRTFALGALLSPERPKRESFLAKYNKRTARNWRYR